MTTFNFAQLERLWIDAGGPQTVAPLMAAIAMAESGGDSGAVNPTDNNGAQTSWGLWQVSNGTHSWPGAQNPLDPVANARYAVAKYNGQGLTAWGTYTSGKYRQYLNGNIPPAASVPGGNAQPAPAPAANVASGGSGVNALADFKFPGQSLITGTLKDLGKITGLALPGVGQIAGAPFGTIKTVTQGLEGIGKSLSAIAAVFSAALWLTQPSSWLRIGSFLMGLLALGIGGYLLATSR